MLIIDHLKLVLNTLLIFSCYMMVFGISGRVIASATVGTAFIMILISANCFITSFRGNELAIIDFLSIRTALNVGTHYKFELTALMLIAWGTMTAWLIWSWGAVHISFVKRWEEILSAVNWEYVKET